MLTPGLESLIGKGIAQYKTFTFGAGGVTRIPVPKGSFIIITDFDYFHFIDKPDNDIPGTPASALFSWDTLAASTDVTWQLNGVPAVPPIITFNTAVPLQAQIDFQAFLNANFPGFSCTVQLIGGVPNQWSVVVDTTTPGTQYNLQTPVVTFDPAPIVSAVGDFNGGTDGSTSIENVIANSTHQLEFRSEKSSNHYVIREDVEITNFAPITGSPGLFYNVRGMYHRDCYLVHTEPVQIDIIKVPTPDTWTVDYGRLDQRSQEASLPRGYGQDPGGLNTVRQATFSVGERYKPLTPGFTGTLAGASQDQLKFNVALGRELEDPSIPLIQDISNGRNYPIVNVGYVLINQDYNDYVKSS